MESNWNANPNAHLSAVLNAAAYKFVRLNDLDALRESVRSQASRRDLKGTVLLAEEGINLFLAGPAEALREFLGWLQQDPRFGGLDVKISASDAVPFKRLLVKIKREIIRMNHPTIRPDFTRNGGRAPAVDAHTLARWLDQGRDDVGRKLVLLDTRNAFEVDVGSFEGAVDYRLHKFSDFPHAVQAHKEALAGKTVVSFCTGGIRCEKAALYMHEAGIEHVLQLDGGILKYFEQTGGRHYRGGCFVFDEREALGTDLMPTRGVAAR